MSAALFADSSALVKLYADEPESDDVRKLSPFVVSQLARVEVPAALWRKHRMGELTATDVAVLVADFESDYFGDIDEPSRFLVVAVTAAVFDAATHLVAVHGLRAYDAMQLASALTVADAVPGGVAAAEGLTAVASE